MVVLILYKRAGFTVSELLHPCSKLPFAGSHARGMLTL